MYESVQLLNKIKDNTVRAALIKALSGDRHLSYGDVDRIVRSTFEKRGTSYEDFAELQTILRGAKALDGKSRALLSDFGSRRYHHYLQNLAKKRQFNLAYKVNHIPTTTPKNRRPGTAMIPLYLTVHSTGNPSSYAKGERAWLTNSTNDRVASFHVVVDAEEAIECVPFGEIAWHAGDGANGTGNTKSISMEMCESGDRDKVLDNAASLAAKILRDKGLGVASLRRHRDWTTKTCPRILIDQDYRTKPEQTWDWFVAKVKELV